MRNFVFVALLCAICTISSSAQDANNKDTKVDTLKAKTLEAVTIRGQKPLVEQRADGITFNAESLPSPAGSDGADILRKVPMLSVDADGGVTMRGSSNIRVFIDGKPSEVYASSVSDALKAIRGENIVKVEVITNPSARYDAEGTDGVINIITRKIRKDATNGSITGVLANRNESIMAEVHSKRGKVLVNADGYYQKYWNKNGAELERTTAQLTLIQRNESRQKGDYFFGGANMLFSIDSLNTLSIGYRARRMPNQTVTVSDNFTEVDDELIPAFRRNIITPMDNKGNSFNAGYNGASQNGRQEISVLAMYAMFNGTSGYDMEQVQHELISYRENFKSNMRLRDFTFQGDYTNSFHEHWKLETGVKLTRKNMNSDNRFGIYHFDESEFVNDAARGNHFSYLNNIYAVYGSVSLKLEKWAIVTGIRYERAKLNAVFQDTSLRVPSYDHVIPQILITRMISEKTSLKFNYTTRIARPYFGYLNPTVNRSDSLTAQYGNPYLRPELTNRYQISLTQTDPKLFKDFALFFNDNRNSIENIRTPLSAGLFESTFRNVGKNRRLGLSATLTWKPAPKFTLGSTFTGQYVWLRSAALGISNSGLMRQLVINSSYKIGAGFSVDFYGFFDSKNLRLQGYRSGWKYYSMTINKKSKNERINLSLRLDAFLTPHTFIKEEVISQAYRQIQTFRYQNQNIRFSASFKLGKKEIENPKMRQLENSD
ncbi:TonB-dependent receptor domain-containing protein [Dyadobacter aurulentus]|uniref:TonB-dependent receptor domain-containing protein n=1 Tax=Dyadobacter sp. UC 10 TaxID=2605428 RepID=UPI0011F16361|nr:TonB-dependent receptor [Dyadobacter sp. UC 10]KAA0989173.1 TonB-dependent receptor [Dyadobacter sp. UC 10]